MSDPVTANLALSVPTRGSDSGTWDTPVNGDMTILDNCAGSVTTIALTNANVVATASQLQAAIIRCTGTLTGNVTITVSAIIKSWIFENNTTGAFTITISGASGNVVALPPGSSQVYWDGTNCNFVNLGKIGELWDYIGSAVPAWVTACTVPPYLNATGATFSAVTYPLLNSILGGTTLPDLRGRLRAALNQTTGRVTTAGSGIDGNTNLSSGGSEFIQTHGHGVTDPQHSHTVPGGTAAIAQATAQAAPATVQGFTYTTSSSSTGVTVNSTGSGSSQNMPPVCVVGITMIRAA